MACHWSCFSREQIRFCGDDERRIGNTSSWKNPHVRFHATLSQGWPPNSRPRIAFRYEHWPNKSLRPTPGSAFSSASRFTSLGPEAELLSLGVSETRGTRDQCPRCRGRSSSLVGAMRRSATPKGARADLEDRVPSQYHDARAAQLNR